MSQRTVAHDFSQEIGDAPIAMAYKRQRRGSKNVKRRAINRTAMPMAIRNRGTPSGYYEIPVRQLIKMYANTSTGLWNTAQNTGAQIGTIGYRGFGMSFELDQTYINLGEGSVSATIASAIPGFAELQSVFDMCKISDIEIECWWTNQESDLSAGTAYGGFDMFVVEDPNDAGPPTNMGTIMQYNKVVRMQGDTNRVFRFKIKPHCRVSMGGFADQDSSTSTTLGGVVPSTYVQTVKPAVTHMGFKGWLDIPTSASGRAQILNILIKQTRRYKIFR